MPRELTILAACPICGNDVWSRPGHLHTYCSKSCGLKSRRGETRHRLSVSERFWPKVEKLPTCWLVTCASHVFGYGAIGVPKDGGGWRNEGMHRVAWWLATGEWPAKGLQVCHNCPGGDNPACVRNDDIGIHIVGGVEYPSRGHLWLGPQAANHQDMIDKGRGLSGDAHPARIDPSYLVRGDQHPARIDPSYLPKGENHVNSRTNDAAVLEMRRRWDAGESTQKELAGEFRLSQMNVSLIVRRKTWRHLP